MNDNIKPQYHVEAYGHRTKPDLAGAFETLPDFDGYPFVFYRKLDGQLLTDEVAAKVLDVVTDAMKEPKE